MAVFKRSLLLICLCSSAWAQATESLAELMVQKEIVLLGEVHDNAEGHRLRQQALTDAVEQGWRPAIAMEQFDREKQPDLDLARQRCGQDADCVIAAAASEKSTWNWAYYRPVIQLALRHDLPLLAANLSRSDASRVVREGYAAVFDKTAIHTVKLDRPLPEDLVREQTAAIQDGHCNRLPAQIIPGMVQAQVARDLVMSKTLLPYQKRSVVLLAGNGHTRRDIGVAHWLDDSQASVLSVGFVEQKPTLEAFDRFYLVKPVQRTNVCDGVKSQ